jgi:hypothetical protein
MYCLLLYGRFFVPCTARTPRYSFLRYNTELGQPHRIFTPAEKNNPHMYF